MAFPKKGAPKAQPLAPSKAPAAPARPNPFAGKSAPKHTGKNVPTKGQKSGSGYFGC